MLPAPPPDLDAAQAKTWNDTMRVLELVGLSVVIDRESLPAYVHCFEQISHLGNSNARPRAAEQVGRGEIC